MRSAPAPVSAAVCGEPEALSVTVRVPVRLPVAVGVKVTEMVQLWPAATVDPQVLVSAKSPEAAMVVMASAAAPEFARVMVCAGLVEPVSWLVKVRVAGESAAAGAAAVAVPAKVIVCGEPEALSVMVSVPERLPAAVGAKVTAMVQLLFAPWLEPQVLLWAKSPEAAIEVMDSAAEPVFMSVAFWAALVVPTAWEANVRVAGARLTSGAAGLPEPLRVTVCAALEALSPKFSRADSVVVVDGVKITPNVQLVPDATMAVVEQVVALDRVKSAAKPPLTAIAVKIRSPGP